MVFWLLSFFSIFFKIKIIINLKVIFILCSGGIVFDILHGTPMIPAKAKDWISTGVINLFNF